MSSRSMSTAPLFSVVIPTRARPERLAACLGSLAAQDYSSERFEVLVSDDGSPVPPDAIVAQFATRLRITLVHGPRAGPAAARNRGAARAVGRVLVFTDDDCIAEPGWLAALERAIELQPAGLIGGAVVNGLPGNRCSAATQLIVTYSYARNDSRSAGMAFFTTCNLAVPAEQFRRLGGFSRAFPLAAGEDYDFCHRWQHAGMPAAHAPDAVVRHLHALTLAGFCRQHFNYGRGLYRCRRRIAARDGARLRLEAPAFYLGLLRFPLQQGSGVAGWLDAALILGSQVATAAGGAWERLRGGGSGVRARGPAVESVEP
jgi:GT2 family glycosyltransferase